MTASTIWRYARQRGAGSILGFIGSGPIAILAGFDLAAALSVSQRDKTANWAHELALVLLTLALGVLLVTLLMVLNAQMYGAGPEQRLALRPEATVDRDVLEVERTQQWADYHLLVRYYNRVTAGLSMGLCATLAGLGAALWSEARGWGSAAAVGLLAVAAGVVLLWSFDRSATLFPGDQLVADVRPDAIDEVTAAAVVRGP
jgi:hypothetical protein